MNRAADQGTDLLHDPLNNPLSDPNPAINPRGSRDPIRLILGVRAPESV